MVDIPGYLKLFRAMGYTALAWEYLFLLLMGAGIVLVGGYLLYRNKISISRLYFGTIVLLGLLYSLVLPPLSAPDEVAHYIASYELSNRLLGLQPLRDSEGHIRIRTEDVFIDDWTGDGDWDNATVVGKRLTRELYLELKERGLLSTGEQGYSYSLQEPVKTTRLAYIFPALGFTLARVLHLGGFGLLYAGRLFNLLFFAVMGTLAIRRLPFGKMLFFSISLFPMLLELAASLSYDCFILGLSFYLIALILDLGFSKERVDNGDLLQLALIAILLSPCKMVYSLLFLLCFLIPVRKFGKIRRYFGSICLVAFCMLGAILAVNRELFLLYLFPAAENVSTVDWVGGTEAVRTYQLTELLRTPGKLLALILETFREKGGFYLETMAGSMLGHLEKGLGLSTGLVISLYAMTGVQAVWGDGSSSGRLRLIERIYLLLVCIFVVILLILSMLGAYTPVGTGYAEGIQGRYFLPVLPLFYIAIHGNLLSGMTGRGERRSRLPFGILYIQVLIDTGLLLFLFRNIMLRSW